MKKELKSISRDFKSISWAKPKEILIGIRDVLIFSFITGGLFLFIDFIVSLIIGG